MTKNFILILLMAFTVVQCGGESKSSQIKLRINPKNPIVITGDKDDLVKAPWFQFSVYVQNDSDEEITVIGLDTKTTLSEPGAPEEVGQGMTAGFFSYTNEDTGVECTYSHFTFEYGPGVFPANIHDSLAAHTAEAKLFLKGQDVNGDGAYDECLSGYPVFTPYGLYRPFDKKNQNFRYKVTVKLLGWFGPYEDQKDRLTKSVTIYTR